jgi:TonB-linked SusC/RagA family outer membrane protein
MKRILLLCLTAVFVLVNTELWAQERTVSGKVTSLEDGSPLPGVNVVLKGTTTGSVTDANGLYRVNVPSEGGTLVFSFIGLKSQEIEIGGRTTVDLAMEQDLTMLTEVVITTAGGLQAREREIGSANAVVSPQALTAGKAVNVASGLQGKIAGLRISGTGSGVNPDYRIVLRGQRSLTGNNQALVVLDNVIVPSTILAQLNPGDIEQVVVLNGAGAAALYGSQASNGALIITTKKGTSGKTEFTISQTEMAQQVAFLPKIQKKFGAGGTAYGTNPDGTPFFNYLENQSYGPAFDGSLRKLGPKLEDGTQLYTPYSYKPGHDDFWNIGRTHQTDFSVTTGDDKSTFYVSGQLVKVSGTTPGDSYTRGNFRVNGTRKIGEKMDATFSTSYAPNRYDITTQTGSIYSNMLNMPSNVDITKLKDWRNNKFANPNGFYNPWYDNPYYSAANWRELDRNNYLTGSIELRYRPFEGLAIVARQNLTDRSYTQQTYNGAFDYTEYSETTDQSSKTDDPANVSEGSGNELQSISELQAQYDKTIGDISINVVGGTQFTHKESRYLNTSIGGLVVNDLYNLSNGVGSPGYGQARFEARQIGVYGRVVLGYKDYLFFTATARNDWDSRLNEENRSFFYPSAEVSLVVSDALPSLKDNNLLSFLKVRGNVSKTGLVNLGNEFPFALGAYQTRPTFSSNVSYGTANGFPYGSLAGYSLSNTLVSEELKPELTKGFEAGFDLNLLDDKIVTSFTYFASKTDDQTVTTQVSRATGFSSLLTNAGRTSSKGIEFTAHYTPLRNNDWDVTFGGNYTYLDNTVDFITADLTQLALAGSGTATSVAVAGQPFPVIMGYDYVRDPQGRVIVDAVTGLPSQTTAPIILGNATAKHVLGLDAAVSFKGIRLSVLMEYRGDYKIFNGIGTEMDWSGTGFRTGAYNREAFVFPNSVIQQGDGSYVENTSVLIANGNGNNGFWSDGINRNVTSNYVTSGDFWKLREVSLSYDLPKTILGYTKVIKKASISLQGRNLFLWMAKDNYYTDPEYSAAGINNNGVGLNSLNQTPPSRNYGATLSLTF